MQQFQTTKRVRHSAENMFHLVSKVEDYPQFVPLCEALTVRSREVRDEGDILIADMTVAYKLIRETFTSRVTLDPATLSILVEYLDGPFRHLENKWRFLPQGSEASDIDFFIAYEFRSRTLQMLMGGLFDKAFRKFTDAFEMRADAVYGAGQGTQAVQV